MPDAHASDLRLRLALRAARQGAWEYDLTQNAGYRSPELQALLGVRNPQPTLADYLGNVQEEDRPRVLQAFQQLSRGERDESVLQYRFVRDDGQALWVEQHTFVERDTQGRAVRLFGLSRDVTAARQLQDELQDLNATLEARVAQRTQELADRTVALDAFVEFTEAVGTETDVLPLVQQAIRVLRATMGEVSVAYYEVRGGLWRAQAWSEDLTPDVVAEIRAGVPEDAPDFREALTSRAPVFADGWDATLNRLPATESYGAVALFPYFERGQAHGLLAVGTQSRVTWSQRDRASIRAVGRSLALALDRADAARQLSERNAQLAARTEALERFADLTRDLSVTADPYALIERAEATVLTLLPPGYAAFWEVRDGRWHATRLTGDVGSADLEVTIEAGLPVGETPTLDLPAQSRTPFYQDVYPQGADTPAEVVRHVNAVATLPVLVGDDVVGVFNVPLFHERSWSAADRTVLETVVRSLGLALERARGVEQLARSNQELQAANEGLEAFTYSVSHDLMTPVRHVSSFSDLALRSVEDPERTQRYLSIINQAARRMSNLIEALLQLSRLGRRDLQMGPVDLQALVEEARQDVTRDLPERRIRWHVHPLPTVHGDPDTLQLVLGNLLDNAVKYTREREEAVIEVWAEERPDAWAVFVRDNGAGFDPQFADKLFTVFQRLHRQEEFEGTGIGLTNVRRIVTRHGGTVGATARPGEGATFSFTLPKER